MHLCPWSPGTSLAGSCLHKRLALAPHLETLPAGSERNVQSNKEGLREEREAIVAVRILILMGLVSCYVNHWEMLRDRG